MGVVIGFVVGYLIGSQQGDKGRAEVREAWQVIRSSEEARYLVSQGLATAKSLVQQGSSLLSERSATPTTGASSLRPTG